MWQANDIPPGGSLYFDSSKKTLEAGKTYGYEANFLVLLDYEGNELEAQNFMDGYKMVEAAEKDLAAQNYNQAKELFIRAMETEISPNTKMSVFKKLHKIAELTNDLAFAEEVSTMKERMENEKAELQNSRNKRKYKTQTDKEKAAKETYMKKRENQKKQYGGR